MRINEIVQDYIHTDDGYNGIQEKRIIQKYRDANDETKAVIDDIFISLTGWSLKSIIDNVTVDISALTNEWNDEYKTNSGEL